MIRLGICEGVYEELIYCKELVDGIMANLSRNAKAQADQECYFIFYQPKTPEKLKDFSRNR